jgi:hypothetical protein
MSASLIGRLGSSTFRLSVSMSPATLTSGENGTRPLRDTRISHPIFLDSPPVRAQRRPTERSGRNIKGSSKRPSCVPRPEAGMLGRVASLTAARSGRNLPRALGATLGPPVLNRNGATLGPAEFVQPLHKSGSPLALAGKRARAKKPDDRRLTRLCPPTTDHAAAPPSPAMNSRRLTRSPHPLSPTASRAWRCRGPWQS